MGTLAKSEDPEEMSHYAAFHPDLHCMLRQNQYNSEKVIQYCFGNYIYNVPS